MNRAKNDDFIIQVFGDTGKIDLDIVCVYNDEYSYREKFFASLKQQETNFAVRVLGIDNTGGKYTSMAQAYNDVIQYLKGTWVLFLHQDVLFNTSKSLEDVMNEVVGLKSAYMVWGAYGVVRNSRITISTKHSPIRVETLDECFFGLSLELLSKLKFNEEVCDNWHMYAVEVCLHNQCMGGECCVVKCDITHLSPGIVSQSYVRTLYRIINYYKKKDIKYIWTTCAKVDLRRAYHIYIFIWSIKHEMLNKIIRPLKEKLVKKEHI